MRIWRTLPALWLFLIAVVLILAPLISGDPMTTRPDAQLLPPQFSYPLGTDYLGRDVWSRLLYGGQRTIIITMLGTLVAVIPGTLLGLLASVETISFDRVASLLISAVMAIPSLAIALVILTVLGRGSIQVAIAAGLAQTMFHARIVRSAVLTLRSQRFIEASRASGADEFWIIQHHIFPGVFNTVLIYAGIVFSYVMINSAALSLLGLAANPSVPDWGSMLADGRFSFRSAPWVAIAPGVMVSSIIISIHWSIDTYFNLNNR